MLIDHINILRNSFKNVCLKRPFIIDAMVILPDHLHAIWQLPEGDDNYSEMSVIGNILHCSVM